VGRWLHSHEEDAGAEQVYRRDDYPFPPSRGRAGFALRADGSMDRLAPGATDRPTRASGVWRLASDVIELEPAGASRLRWRIIAVEADRLVVRAELD
jgi:hypothetical protein